MVVGGEARAFCVVGKRDAEGRRAGLRCYCDGSGRRRRKGFFFVLSFVFAVVMTLGRRAMM